jgi:hypothetical protein
VGKEGVAPGEDLQHRQAQRLVRPSRHRRASDRTIG